MSRKVSVLKRIVTLYGLVEEMHSLTLRATAASVREAEVAIARQSGQGCEAAQDRRAALEQGDLQQWVAAGTQLELSGLRRRELEVVRATREIATEAARSEYVASRIKSEQMKTVVAQRAVAAELIEGRRTQGRADDRFLSRLRWNELRNKE